MSCWLETLASIYTRILFIAATEVLGTQLGAHSRPALVASIANMRASRRQQGVHRLSPSSSSKSPKRTKMSRMATESRSSLFMT